MTGMFLSFSSNLCHKHSLETTDSACNSNFRENRFFTPWNRPRHVEKYNLPPLLQQHQGVRQIPIGDVILSFNDTSLAAETCEELFTPQAPHINMYVFYQPVPITVRLSNLLFFQGSEWR